MQQMKSKHATIMDMDFCMWLMFYSHMETCKRGAKRDDTQKAGLGQQVLWRTHPQSDVSYVYCSHLCHFTNADEWLGQNELD